MKSDIWNQLDPNELPFIDCEMAQEEFNRQFTCTWDYGLNSVGISVSEQQNIEEAITQVQSCICALNNQETRSARREAKEVLQIIRKNLNWEKYEELKNKVNMLQSLLYKAV
ncbi:MULTISPECIES: hypothetical protein [Acinetobacter]|uniref:Uncharacterized protein n=1 Tax=Acinetobacter higginsii TaxID=70347 RepID=N9SQ56_9GAMM|nr:MULTISPECIES: hypothetical protein [Acinetobacter]ENX53240.1 hypothetical protein F902_04109 [Acinetobacter higginsii]